MKTKQIRYILVGAALITMGFLSCKKDSLLNQYPPTTLNDANYWTSVGDLQNYVNNFYSNGSIFPLYIGDFNGLGMYTIDENSDNMVPVKYEPGLNGENTVASSGGYADWADIRNANYFLANYSRVSASWSQVAPYVGEALFFRAMLYFNGLKSYGDLPWISQPLNVNDSSFLYAPRLERDIVVDSIVRDLDSAIAYLPSKSNAQSMRVYREFAQAYKARVCLYEGTWEKYHAKDKFGIPGKDGKTFIQLAADATADIIASGIFSLDNNGVYNGYWNLFNQTDYSGSKEVIFWGATLGPSVNGNNEWQGSYQSGSDGTAKVGLSRRLIDSYLCIDGKPISASSWYEGDDSLKTLAANRDPRLRQTMFLPGDTVVIGVNGSAVLFTHPAILASNSQCPTGYQLYKGLNTDPGQNPGNGISGATDAVIYMRYAEVLLIYAEAKAELGTINQSDLDKSINLLRDRVGMPHLVLSAITPDPDWEFPMLSPIINEVRRERRVELACEGFRFDDLCRWAAGNLLAGWKPLGAKVKQFLSINFAPRGSSSTEYLTIGSNIYANSQGYIEPYQKTTSMPDGYKFNINRDYLLPIDLQDITLNPKLQQNPGWGTK